MSKIVPHMVYATLTFILICGGRGRAEDEKEELMKFQGTWQLVEYENSSGKEAPKKESLWVFNGAKLYRKSVIENVYEIRLDPKLDPKLLEMKVKYLNTPDVFGSEFAIYKFVGERLIITTSRSTGKRPEAFVPTKLGEGIADLVLTLKRIDKKAKIPEELLKRFEVAPSPRTKNREAEATLVKLISVLAKRESLEVVEPLVADGKAEQIVKMSTDLARFLPEEVDSGVKQMTARDVVIGERLIGTDGEEFEVQSEHFGPDKVLLVLQERGVDQQTFWLYKQADRWKVDVTGLIAMKQSNDLKLFGGIVIGMKRSSVQIRLENYKNAQRLKSYSMTKSTDSELIVDWKEGKEVVRHTMTFTDGKLAGYTTKDLAK